MGSTDEPKEWDIGWYPDPDHPGDERFWNGATWQERRPATSAPTVDEHITTPHRRTMWFVIGGVAAIVVAAIVLSVVLVAGSDPIVEDDDAEFREVSITDCAAPGALAPQQVHGVAENGSSERSDYRIEVAVFATDGTRIGTGSADVTDVEPGQRAVWTIDTDTLESDWDDGSTCEVLGVERTASF